jgi:hypothetical protein
MKEIWKDIPGYETLYQASNLGRIRSMEHLVFRTNKPMIIPKKYWSYKGHNLKLNTDSEGYIRCTLSKSGKTRRYLVHRIIAMTFIPNPQSLPQINHIDEDKHNNRIENLEWCTANYNLSFNGGRKKRALTKTGKPNLLGSGENHYASKLKNGQVVDIYRDQRNYKEISAHYNISITTVYDIKKKRRWTNLLKTI